MSIFKQTKDAIMLLITVFVMIFITGFLYLVLGNYAVGSAIDVSDQETELVALRTLKCLENENKLEDCIKTDKYGIEIFWYEDEERKHKYVDKEIFEKVSKTKFVGGGTVYLFHQGTLMSFGKLHPGILIRFEK